MVYPDWFSKNIPLFDKFLSEYKNKDDIRFLQVGVYCGDASVWLLNNILTSSKSKLVDVDTWKGSNEPAHESLDWNDIEQTYNQKISQYKNIEKIKGTSEWYLTHANRKFDFIYIDGDHTSEGVYKDASLSWNLLVKNGIMAFDDYEWNHPSNDPAKRPKNGIDKFLDQHSKDITILHRGYQIWLRKMI